MNETQQAETLAAVLAGTTPGSDLDTDVRETLAVFKPELAPPVPIDADTMWAAIQPGLPEQGAPVPELPAPANRSWLLAAFGAGGMGFVGIAAAALLAFTATLGSTSRVYESDMAAPVAVQSAAEPMADTGTDGSAKTEPRGLEAQRARPRPRAKAAHSQPLKKRFSGSGGGGIQEIPAAPADRSIAEVAGLADGAGDLAATAAPPPPPVEDAVAFADDEAFDEDLELEEAYEQEPSPSIRAKKESRAAGRPSAPAAPQASLGEGRAENKTQDTVAFGSDAPETAPSERNMDALRRRAQRGTSSVESSDIAATRAALDAGDPRTALSLATAALETASPLEQQRLWVLKGDAHVLLGETAKAEQAWLRADALRRGR